MLQPPYYVQEPKGKKVPIIISVPHCGTEFPYELLGHYKKNLSKTLDDTDWFVDKLYDWASEMGITVIKARFHRWVIDLNRNPESKPLYDDGRIITPLCTLTDFFGNKIYNDSFEPKEREVERRLKKYYWPYYAEIQRRIDELKQEFGEVLFYDAHSIRKKVETIQSEAFPDLILGTNDGKSANQKYIDIALKHLKSSSNDVSYNHPFKGGHLTRYFGKPENHQHALQLERAKVLYMNDEEVEFDEERASKHSEMLKSMFEEFVETMLSAQKTQG